MVRQHAPLARTLLDVGTGPALYLNDYKAEYERVVATDMKYWPIWEALGTEKAVMDFLRAKLGTFDVVTCLQCLEHIKPEQRVEFIDNLFAHTGHVLLVSLPYRWVTGGVGHIGINEAVILNWFGVEPAKSRIVTEAHGGQRILNLYEARK